MEELIMRQGEFDLVPEVAARCEERLALARTHMAAGFYHWLEAGKQFSGIKQDVGPRKWGPWLDRHGIARSSADMLVQIADRFDPILLTVSNIDELQVDLRALQALSVPAVPVAVSEAAIERAATGEHITRTEAEKMIAEASGAAAVAAADDVEKKMTKRVETAEKQAAKLNERLADTAERASRLSEELAQLKIINQHEITQAREKVAAQYEGKMILSEEDLRAEVSKLMKPSEQKIELLEKALERERARRERAQDRLELLREKQKQQAGSPQMPPFDSNLSMKALVVRQTVENMRAALSLSAAEHIAIEIEFSTRMHNKPELAHQRLSAMVAIVRDDLVPWFQEFLRLYPGESS